MWKKDFWWKKFFGENVFWWKKFFDHYCHYCHYCHYWHYCHYCGKKEKKTTSLNLYWSYYPHRSRELVSPVCGIFFVSHHLSWLLSFRIVNCYLKHNLQIFPILEGLWGIFFDFFLHWIALPKRPNNGAIPKKWAI